MNMTEKDGEQVTIFQSEPARASARAEVNEVENNGSN